MSEREHNTWSPAEDGRYRATGIKWNLGNIQTRGVEGVRAQTEAERRRG